MFDSIELQTPRHAVYCAPSSHIVVPATTIPAGEHREIKSYNGNAHAVLGIHDNGQMMRGGQLEREQDERIRRSTER